MPTRGRACAGAATPPSPRSNPNATQVLRQRARVYRNGESLRLTIRHLPRKRIDSAIRAELLAQRRRQAGPFVRSGRIEQVMTGPLDVRTAQRLVGSNQPTRVQTLLLVVDEGTELDVHLARDLLMVGDLALGPCRPMHEGDPIPSVRWCCRSNANQ